MDFKLNGFKNVNYPTLIENLPDNFWEQPSLKLGLLLNITLNQ